MKKLLFIVFSLISFVSKAYDFEVDGFYYDIISLDDMTCKVVSGTNKYEGDLKIPTTVTYKNRTLKVTEIGYSAFYECSSLTSVEIPTSVTEIGGGAFHSCSSLTSIVIPNSVKEIGGSAIRGCSNLISIDIPNSVLVIGEYAFYQCSSLISVSISHSVVRIRKAVFSGCSSLTTIEIPDLVKWIEEDAFYHCSSLESIVIPGSVTQIGRDAFSDVSTLIVEKGKEKLSYECFIRKDYYPFSREDYPFNKLEKLIAKRYIDVGKDEYGNTLNTYRKVFPNVTDLYIDNFELNDKTICIKVKTLTIGKNATIESKFSYLPSSLESITLENSIPPFNYPVCSAKQYTDVILYVPKGSLAAYQAAEGWRKFWDIREVESSGIEEAEVDNNIQEVGRYNLQGQAVTDDYRGLIIVKYSDGTVKKVLNK